MPRIVFVQFDGGEQPVHAEISDTVMQAAKANLIPGITADCGGNCACGTCHVYVERAWIARLPAPRPEELDTLLCVDHPRPESRLSCQIRMTPELDGLTVHVPTPHR